MDRFLQNLALLAVLAIALFVLFPDAMNGILGVYSGIGILPIVVILVIAAALPRKSRRRR